MTHPEAEALLAKHGCKIHQDYGVSYVNHERAVMAVSKALAERDEALAEVKRCHRRLEIDRLWSAEGKPFDVPKDARSKVPDGIECRDDTISLQKYAIDQLRAKLDQAVEVLRPFAEAGCPEGVSPMDLRAAANFIKECGPVGGGDG